MKKEDSDLLFRDLCSRLPYGVKVESVFINPDTKERKSCGIEVFDATSILMIRDGLGEFKPYLFPLSSMTEEQRNELKSLLRPLVLKSLDEEYEDIEFPTLISTNPSVVEIDFYNKYHFDYRGLIPMGLAIDATGKGIYGNR